MCYLLCGQESAAGFVDIENNRFMAAANGYFDQAIAFAQQTGITFPDFTFKNNLCIHGVYAQFNAFADGNLSTLGMDTPVATSVIPNSSVTSNVFYKADPTDTDYPLGVISDGAYQPGSDNNNDDPLYSAIECDDRPANP